MVEVDDKFGLHLFKLSRSVSCMKCGRSGGLTPYKDTSRHKGAERAKCSACTSLIEAVLSAECEVKRGELAIADFVTSPGLATSLKPSQGNDGWRVKIDEELKTSGQAFLAVRTDSSDATHSRVFERAKRGPRKKEATDGHRLGDSIRPFLYGYSEHKADGHDIFLDAVHDASINTILDRIEHDTTQCGAAIPESKMRLGTSIAGNFAARMKYRRWVWQKEIQQTKCKRS